MIDYASNTLPFRKAKSGKRTEKRDLGHFLGKVCIFNSSYSARFQIRTGPAEHISLVIKGTTVLSGTSPKLANPGCSSSTISFKLKQDYVSSLFCQVRRLRASRVTKSGPMIKGSSHHYFSITGAYMSNYTTNTLDSVNSKQGLPEV